jgi:hypothetical protein
LVAHNNPQRGEHVGNDCFTKLHNDHCFGLAIADCKLLKTDESRWRMPTNNDKEKIRVTSKRSSGSSLMVYVGMSQRLRIVEDSIKKQKIVHTTLHLYIFNNYTIIHCEQRIQPSSSLVLMDPSKSQLLWDPLFTPDLSTFLIGIIKLKLS